MPADWQPCARLSVVRERARVYAQIRAFFDQRGCLEVDTPLLMRHTNPDANISSIQTTYAGRSGFLQTSPEFAMKRLLAAGSGSIYQLCHAFRDGEQGRLHRPEFSLLEWYREGYDYWQLMDEIELLITSLSLRYCEFDRICYQDLFRQHLHIDLGQIGLDELRQVCRVRVPGTDTLGLSFDECLDLLLGVVITPSIQGYLFVHDYPMSQASLARRKAGTECAERFELFHNGVELANGFSELTDAKEQRTRFERDNQMRVQRGLPEYAPDEAMLAALEAGMPDCAGVALGLDRLLMVLLDLDSIDQVLTFADT